MEQSHTSEFDYQLNSFYKFITREVSKEYDRKASTERNIRDTIASIRKNCSEEPSHIKFGNTIIPNEHITDDIFASLENLSTFVRTNFGDTPDALQEFIECCRNPKINDHNDKSSGWITGNDYRRPELLLSGNELEQSLRAYAQNIASYFPKEDKSELKGDLAMGGGSAEGLGIFFGGIIINSAAKLTKQEEEKFIEAFVKIATDKIKTTGNIDENGNLRRGTSSLNDVFRNINIAKDHHVYGALFYEALEAAGLKDRESAYEQTLPNKTHFTMTDSGAVIHDGYGVGFSFAPIQADYLPAIMTGKDLLEDQTNKFAVVKLVDDHHLRVTDPSLFSQNNAATEHLNEVQQGVNNQIARKNYSIKRDNEYLRSKGVDDKTRAPIKEAEIRPKHFDLPRKGLSNSSWGNESIQRTNEGYTHALDRVETQDDFLRIASSGDRIDEDDAKRVARSINYSGLNPDGKRNKVAITSPEDSRFRAYATRDAYLACKIKADAMFDTEKWPVLLKKDDWVIIDPKRKVIVQGIRSKDMNFGYNFLGHDTTHNDDYPYNNPMIALCDQQGKIKPDHEITSPNDITTENFHSLSEIDIPERKGSQRVVR
jgi:hypothetical protein